MARPRTLAPAALLAAALLLAPAAAQAQRGYGGYARNLPEGLQGDRTGFSFCRLAYRQVYREAGGQGWTTDYPNADRNLMFRAEELTTIEMSKYPGGDWAHSIVTATHPDLFRCPFLFASDVGTMSLTEEEATQLRLYLEKGGFLWVDDFWGDQAWRQWESQLRRIVPGKEWVDLTPAHPLFQSLYHVLEIPQIPSINQWRRSGGQTSERGYESRIPHIRAVYDAEGRIMILMSHNTDIADGWEREGEDQEYFYLFSPDAYAIAVNVLAWMMTH